MKKFQNFQKILRGGGYPPRIRFLTSPPSRNGSKDTIWIKRYRVSQKNVPKICVYKNGRSSLQVPRINLDQKTDPILKSILGGVCFLVQIDWINRKRDKTDSSFLKEHCFDYHNSLDFHQHKCLDFHHHKTIKNLVKIK